MQIGREAHAALTLLVSGRLFVYAFIPIRKNNAVRDYDKSKIWKGWLKKRRVSQSIAQGGRNDWIRKSNFGEVDRMTGFVKVTLARWME